MSFWARRPVDRNLAGILLVLLVFAAIVAIQMALFPEFDDDLLMNPAMLYLAGLLAIVAVVLWYDQMPLSWVGLGFHRWTVRELVLGVAFGVGMAVTAWGPIAIAGEFWPDSLFPGSGLFYWTVLIMVKAFGEELLFRGYLFQRIMEIIGPTAATLIVSTLFAAAHLGNPGIGVVALINIFLAGIFFTLCYLRTGSLWLPFGVHFAWNFSFAKLLGLPVSGTDFGIAVFQTDSIGPVWLFGGHFGPEAGLVTTIALLLWGVVLVKSRMVTPSPYVHAKIFRSVYRKKSGQHEASGSV